MADRVNAVYVGEGRDELAEAIVSLLGRDEGGSWRSP